MTHINRFNNTWTARLILLQAYVAREGHCLVPKTHVEANVNLGTWVVAQRQAHRNNKLSELRTRALEAVPGWTWTVRGESWEENFSLLEQYAKANAKTGKPIPEVKIVVNAINIGVWTRDQRKNFREGKLSPDRANRLASIPGWEWKMKRGRPTVQDKFLNASPPSPFGWEADAGGWVTPVRPHAPELRPFSPELVIPVSPADSCAFFELVSQNWQVSQSIPRMSRTYGQVLLTLLQRYQPTLVEQLRELDDDPFEAATPYDISLEAFAVIMEEWDKAAG